MQYRHLGSSGLRISALSLGSWLTYGKAVDTDVTKACMLAAYDTGVNFFDTAEVYAAGAAEEAMGQVIREVGWKRSDLVISTKLMWGGEGPNDRGLSRKHIIEGMDASLQRLQMDYVDLVFCHRPDVTTPLEETVRAMSHLVNTGRAFYWGTSEWPAQALHAAYEIARREHLVPPTMEQPQYNMFHRDRVESEYAPLYEAMGLGTTIWSPLASGILTGKYNDGVPEGSRGATTHLPWLRESLGGPKAAARIAKVKQMQSIADDLGCTMAALALAWCLRNPHVSSVITGASRAEQVVANMKALDVVAQLSDDVMARLDEILDNTPKPPVNFRD